MARSSEIGARSLAAFVERGIRRAQAHAVHSMKSEGASPFAALPSDLLRLILAHLPRRSRLLGACFVCKRWLALGREAETHLTLYGPLPHHLRLCSQSNLCGGTTHDTNNTLHTHVTYLTN